MILPLTSLLLQGGMECLEAGEIIVRWMDGCSFWQKGEWVVLYRQVERLRMGRGGGREWFGR